MNSIEDVVTYLDKRIGELSNKRNQFHINDAQFSTQLWSRINELKTLKSELTKSK